MESIRFHPDFCRVKEGGDGLKVAVLCISDAYMVRGKALMDYYQKQGNEVRLYTPDFSHRKKERIVTADEDRKKGINYLHHRPYSHNLSYARLLGHMEFASLCKSTLEAWKPDRIHAMVPANSIAHEMAEYKKEHPETQLIFDVNDLWPESLPLKFLKYTPPAWYWKKLRASALPQADLVLAECGLFADLLAKEAGKRPDVLYWSSTAEESGPSQFAWSDTSIGICYLGSMNNIIDIEWIADFLRVLSTQIPVLFHLIGSGEKKEQLLSLESERLKVIDHGELFDEAAKKAVIDQCRFGLNVMKPHVCVGLSMKSIDYMRNHLPLISSLEGDTRKWIQEQGIGFQCARPDETARSVLEQTQAEHEAMRRKAYQVYRNHLSKEAFEAQLGRSLQSLEAGRAAEKETAEETTKETVKEKSLKENNTDETIAGPLQKGYEQKGKH